MLPRVRWSACNPRHFAAFDGLAAPSFSRLGASFGRTVLARSNAMSASEPPRMRASLSGAYHSGPTTASLRVAIVDDEPLLRRILALTLRCAYANAFVEGFACGADAIRAAAESTFDLAIVDRHMPGF